MSHTDETNILMALRELLTTNAEWRDKVIYALPDDDDETPLDDLDYQNWATTVYLPVPVAAKDKSENAAFDRFVAHLRERGKVLAALASPAAAPTSQPNAAAQEQQAGWMPIESAPKDGTNVLLTNGINVAQGWWEHVSPYIHEKRDVAGVYHDQEEHDGFDGWIDCEGGMQPGPTHYMLLPPAPAPTGMGSVGLPSGRGEEQS